MSKIRSLLQRVKAPRNQRLVTIQVRLSLKVPALLLVLARLLYSLQTTKISSLHKYQWLSQLQSSVAKQVTSHPTVQQVQARALKRKVQEPWNQG